MNSLIEQYDNMMADAGVRPSPVRSLVLRTLDASSTPLSSLEIEERLGSVDRSSITRSLAVFSDTGLVHTVDDGSGSVRYELCRSPHHHDIHDDRHPHFHCTVCGVTECLISQPIPDIKVPEGYMVNGINVVIQGVCPDCQKKL